MTLRKIIFLAYLSTLASRGLVAATAASVTFDCVHKISGGAATQDCLNVTSLKLRFNKKASKNTEVTIEIDPFASPASSISDQVETKDLIKPKVTTTSLGSISDFSLDWQFRPRLRLRLGLFGGSTNFPKIHQLSMGSRFTYTGWSQSALSAIYVLGSKKDTKIEITLGNGEGELTQNLDTQQYAGLMITHQLSSHLDVYLGASRDMNNTGSEGFIWAYGGSLDEIIAGFSVERKAISLHLSDLFGFAPGLTTSLSFHHMEARDVDKNIIAVPPESYISNPRLRLRDLVVEDPTQEFANTCSSENLDVSLKYAILAVHYLVLTYETRSYSAGRVDFFADNSGQKFRKISQTAITTGASILLSQGLEVLFEYHRASYNKVLQEFSYQGTSNINAKNIELFNLRFSRAI